VSHDHVEAEHEEQQGEAALQEPVEGPGNPAEPEQPHHLKEMIYISIIDSLS